MVSSMMTKVSANRAGKDLEALYDKVQQVFSGQAFEPPKPGEKKKKLVEDNAFSDMLDKHPKLRENALAAISKLTNLPITDELYGAGKGIKDLLNEWQETVMQKVQDGADIATIVQDEGVAKLTEKLNEFTQTHGTEPLNLDNALSVSPAAPKPGQQ